MSEEPQKKQVRSQEGKFDIRLGARLAKKLKEGAEATGLSAAQLIRNLVTDYIEHQKSEQFAPPAGKRENETARKQRFLASVEELYHVSKACKATGISMREVRTWQADSPEFNDDLADAFDSYVESVEAELLKLGRGELKGGQGAFLAFQSFLNAHHPQHGRLKREAFNKALGPLVKSFYEAVAEETTPEVATRVTERMQAIADRALNGFAD